MIKEINILDLVVILGAIQGIIFSIYLGVHPLRNRKASTFLSIFILAFAANSIYHALETIGLRGYLNAWDFTPFYCPLLIITGFHLFIKFLINPNWKMNNWEKLIFVPYALQLAMQLWGLYWVFRDRNHLLENQIAIFRAYNTFDILTVVGGILILSSGMIKMKRYDQNLQDNYAEIGNFSLRWLNKLLLLLLIIWMLFTIPSIYELISGNTLISMYYPLWIASSGLIYWIGYSTYFRRQTISPVLFDQSADESAFGSPSKLSLNTKNHHDRLLDLMQSKKPFLNQDLNLKILSDELDLSSGYLSQIIKQYEKKNFFEFVNTYRVEAVKEKLGDSKFNHLNLLGIAYESGFKSKSTFNLAFKKITGITPTAYKKSKNNTSLPI